MPTIEVGRYAHPETHGYCGWVQPADRRWMLCVATDGTPELYTNRDPATGGILDG